MALVRRDENLEELNHDDMTASEHLQEQDSSRILRLLAQAVGSFGFATSVVAIFVVWFMPTLKPDQPNYQRRAAPPRRSRRDSAPLDAQSIIIPRRSLTALLSTAPPSRTAFPRPQHVRRVTFNVILSKPSRSHLAARRPPPRITLVSQDLSDSVEFVKNGVGQEEGHSPGGPSPSSSIGSTTGFSSPGSLSSCSSAPSSFSSSVASSTTTLETPPVDVLTYQPDIASFKYEDRGAESDASSRCRLSIPLHRRLPGVKRAFKNGTSKPPSSYSFPTPTLRRSSTDTAASDTELVLPQRRSTLPFWPRNRKSSQTDGQILESNEKPTPPPCGSFVRRLSLQRNDKPAAPPTPTSKESRRRSTPVPRTQPYGYPHFAPTPIPLSDIPDPEFPAYLKELTRQTRPSNADPSVKSNQRAQASLGVGRTRPSLLRDVTL